jgi:hypothetical protein
MSGKATTMRTVWSDDRPHIAFEQTGDGPPAVLAGGALASGTRSFPPFVHLAALLSPRYTVFSYDRRGRSASGESEPYAVQREVEDLEAIIAETGGARNPAARRNSVSSPKTAPCVSQRANKSLERRNLRMAQLDRRTKEGHHHL